MQQFKEDFAKMIENNINSGNNLQDMQLMMQEVLIDYMYGGLPGQRFMLNVQNQCPDGKFTLEQANAYSLMTLLMYDWIRKEIIPMDHNPEDLQAFTEMLCDTFENLARQFVEEGKQMKGFSLEINYTEPAEGEQTENEDSSTEYVADDGKDE